MMILALLITQPAAIPAPCRYDRAHLLALDQDAFDQDMTGGWRKLEQDGCEAEAADLIKDWRIRHRAKDSILFWHEGQLRADLGQTADAVRLFERSYKTAADDRGMGWNLYVDGTIAFLRRDRTSFGLAKAKLAALPRPPGFTFQGPDGKPLAVKWPLNMNVFEGLERCWDKPYKEAYGCATPMRRVPYPTLNNRLALQN